MNHDNSPGFGEITEEMLQEYLDKAQKAITFACMEVDDEAPTTPYLPVDEEEESYNLIPIDFIE